ncbi:MAG: hypothetical protein EBR46_07570 [Betaproteobacteria bacterium]|nr:hypothetical protein [Betaproteobacteria bacterium]
MSRPWQCDIAVIGASLGGVLAAWRASQAGQRVLLVFRSKSRLKMLRSPDLKYFLSVGSASRLMAFSP